MTADRDSNRQILEATVEQLGPLADEMVFLGGCATSLLITDPAAAQVRITYNVDVIAEVASYIEYQNLAERLRVKGFREDPEAGVICRWRCGPLLLDVMPTNERVLGFSNRWYAGAAKAARLFALTAQRTIRLISPVYFLATKLEAFDGRGNGDFLLSQDVEDIISLIDGRPELPAEIATENSVVAHLRHRPIRSPHSDEPVLSG